MQVRERVASFLATASKLMIASLFVVGSTLLSLADTPSGESLPAENQPVESAALRYALHDQARAQEAASQVAAKAAEVATQVQNLEAAVKSATEAKVAAEADVTTSAAETKQAESILATTKTAAEEATAAAQKLADDPNADADLVAEAKKLVETTTAAVTAAAEALKTAQEKQAAAAAKVPELTKGLEKTQADLKVASEARAEVDKRVAALAPIVESASAKVELYKSTSPVADPAQIHLVSTYKHDRPFMSCRIHPNGDLVYAGSQDNSIQRWDLLFGTNTSFVAHRSWVKTMAFDQQSNLMVSGSYAGELNWWNTAASGETDPSAAENPKPVRSMNAHKGYVRGVAFSQDSKLLATAGNDLIIRIWSTEDGSLVKELSGHERHVYNLAFHPDGRSLISGDLMGIVKHWDLESWELVRDLDAGALSKYDPTFRADCGGVRTIEFSPDGRFLAVGGIGEVTNAFAGIGKPTVMLFDWLTGQVVHTLHPKGNAVGSVFSLQYHPTGKYLIGAGGGTGGAIWFWKPDEGEAIQDFALPNVAYDMALHPDGMRLTVALYDSTIRVYDLGPKPPDAKK